MKLFKEVDYLALLEKITTQDVVDFFAQVKGGGACPVCGDEMIAHTSMRRTHDGIEQDRAKPAIVHKLIQPKRAEQEPFELPVFVASCDTCGFTADFSMTPILEWMASRADEE